MCQIRDIKSRNLRWKKQEVLKCTLYRKQSQSGQKGETARFRVKQIIKTTSFTPVSEVSVKPLAFCTPANTTQSIHCLLSSVYALEKKVWFSGCERVKSERPTGGFRFRLLQHLFHSSAGSMRAARILDLGGLHRTPWPRGGRKD